jgi:hypothetical protein
VKHAALLDLLITHTYYTDGRCPDFAITPSVETARILRAHRCVMGSSPAGARVSIASDSPAQPFLPLPPGAVLRFQLELRNSDFSFFTDLPGIFTDSSEANKLKSTLFTNASLAVGAAGELALVTGDIPRRPGVFANVEIRMDSLGFGEDAPTFRVPFRAKQSRWVYYCITDLPEGGDDVTIVDTAPASAGERLLFGDENRTSLDDQNPDTSDPIAAQIAGRYPGMRCVRMISDQAVACREEPRKHLELRLRNSEDRLSGPLPNPSVRSISKMTAQDAQQELLFQIIKYRAQPLLPNT